MNYSPGQPCWEPEGQETTKLSLEANYHGDCLLRRSDQWNRLSSGSSCFGEKVEGIVKELLAGEKD